MEIACEFTDYAIGKAAPFQYKHNMAMNLSACCLQTFISIIENASLIIRVLVLYIMV